MTLIVDASVLVAALVDSGPEGVWAEELVARGALHAPNLARAEATNILRRLERAKELSATEAASAFEDLMLLDLQSLPFEPFAERVWELRHAVTSYDAWYVAAAETLDAPLATLDAALTRATGPACAFLTPPRR